MESELYHYGVKGMRWGVRRKSKDPGYRSTGLRSRLAKRSNDKVDASFKKWNEGAKARDNAIDLGKKANAAKRAYDNDRSNKDLKSAYKEANKAYKKALSENTTYRKGAVRQKVGQDISRKYLSEAKQVKKELVKDPTNKQLQKKYNNLMSKHDVERAKARRAPKVAQRRSKAKANMKRTLTVTVKAAAASAAVAGGAYAVNRYLSNHNVTVNGQRVSLNAQNIGDVAKVAKQVKDLLGFLY